MEQNTLETFGFEWVLETVAEKHGGEGPRLPLGDGPIPVVRDLAKFEASFPGVALAALDGSSIRVQAQDVVRRMLKSNRRTPVDTMKDAVLARLKGIKTKSARVVEVKVYALPDGTNTQDLAEFKAAWNIE